MAFTVKKLSDLSGISVRTLYFYEEIGLLKPTYYGANGYRYYEEKELLLLQQILFFKELGLTLKQIQKIVGKSDFDQLAALYSHKHALTREWEKIGELLKTIERTIKHLKGQRTMKDKEIFDGFNIALVKKAKKNTSYSAAEEIVANSVKNPTRNIQDVEKRGKAHYDNITKTAHTLFSELVLCLNKQLPPTAAEMQQIIAKHYAFAETMQNMTSEVYLALAQLYREHPEFRKQLDPFHPQLADYMAQAMKIYAERN